MKRLHPMAIALISIMAALAGRSADELPARPRTVALSQTPDGFVHLLARDSQPHGTTIRYEPQPHKNTIGYWTKTEDWVSWDFTVAKPGVFEVELTQACGRGSGGSTFFLNVAGQSLTNTVPDTGAFTNFIQRVIGDVTLATPGAYTLSVKPIQKPGVAVMDLRAVVLRPKS